MTEELVKAAFSAWAEKVFKTNPYLVEESKHRDLVYYSSDVNPYTRYGNVVNYNIYFTAGALKLTVNGGKTLANAFWDEKNGCLTMIDYKTASDFPQQVMRKHILDFLMGYSQLIYDDMQLDNNAFGTLESIAKIYLEKNNK